MAETPIKPMLLQAYPELSRYRHATWQRRSTMYGRFGILFGRSPRHDKPAHEVFHSSEELEHDAYLGELHSGPQRDEDASITDKVSAHGSETDMLLIRFMGSNF
jgi:hypothetical protein